MIDIHRIGSLTLETEFSQTPYLLSDYITFAFKNHATSARNA